MNTEEDDARVVLAFSRDVHIAQVTHYFLSVCIHPPAAQVMYGQRDGLLPRKVQI